MVYNVKKTSSVTFQQTHCITLDVNAPNNGSGSGRSIELLTCLAKYFAEEVHFELYTCYSHFKLYLLLIFLSEY